MIWALVYLTSVMHVNVILLAIFCCKVTLELEPGTPRRLGSIFRELVPKTRCTRLESGLATPWPRMADSPICVTDCCGGAAWRAAMVRSAGAVLVASS